MNHDYAHCGNYDRDTCPEKCFRAVLTEDLKSRPDLWGVPMTYSDFKGTAECPLTRGEAE